jgi:hypothetical protein
LALAQRLPGCGIQAGLARLGFHGVKLADALDDLQGQRVLRRQLGRLHKTAANVRQAQATGPL